MSTRELLSELLDLDIKLWVEGDRLRFSAPQGSLSPSLRERILHKKKELIDSLQSSSGSKSSALVSGDLPLIPTLRVNYGGTEPQKYWRLLEEYVEVPRALSPAMLSKVVAYLLEHHDGLRLRMTKAGADFRFFIADEEHNAFEARDLSSLSEEEQDRKLDEAIEGEWAKLDLEEGPLLRFVHFELGPNRLPRMLILLHHFAADAYSLQILLDDFGTCCLQSLSGAEFLLPRKTSSIKDWAERSDRYVKSEEAQDEVAYWKSLPWSRLKPPPVDHPEVQHSAQSEVRRSLSQEETDALLFKVPLATQTQLFDILLTGCFSTLSQTAGEQPYSVMILHQNRASNFDEVDLSRSVGAFFTSFPFVLDSDSPLSSLDPTTMLELVKKSRAQIPNGGSNWQWVSYYSDEPYVRQWDNIKIAKSMILNYLGTIKPNAKNLETMLKPISRPQHDAIKPVYDVNGVIQHTCTVWIEDDELQMKWTYFSAVHNLETIERLADGFMDVLHSLIAK